MTTPGPVVVGVDGSPSSRQAVALAAQLAARRERPLHIVHAFIWPLLRVPVGPLPEGPAEGGLAHDADALLAGELAFARGLDLPITVSGSVEVGAAARVLLTEADGAAMVVIGDRGLGGFASLMLGSVAVEVAAHAPCPVVVARGETDRRGDILAGVDGSDAAARALDLAAEEAGARGVGVTALHAYTHPTSLGPGDMLPLVYDPAEFAEEENALLQGAVTATSAAHLGVAITPRLVHGEPRHALLDAARTASMVVVGSRGRGGLTGLLLGSVSHALLHHASCPVAIVR